MEGVGDRRSHSFASIQYHYPNLRFDGSTHANSSRNVSLSMWENLTSHEIRGVFVFTYCHVDGEPIWDGSSAVPNSAVTSSRHLRDVSRGKHSTEVEASQIWNIHMNVWSNTAGACCARVSRHLPSVFHDTVIPDVAFCAVIQPGTLALTRLGHTPLFWS